MKSFTGKLWIATVAILLCTAFAVHAGVIDFDTATSGLVMAEGAVALELKTMEKAMKEAFEKMTDNIKKAQDTATDALEQSRKEGTITGEMNKKLTEIGETGIKLAADFKATRDEFTTRLQEVEQKLAKKPGGGQDQPLKTAGDIIVESKEYKSMIDGGEFKMNRVKIPGGRKTIANATGQNQPLVPADRVAGIIMPAQRRLTIRDLLPVVRTQSNLVEYCQELVFTNNAGPQYDNSSPTPHAEGAPKNESNITFQLANVPVVTMAHWVGASRQVLADAQQLADYINTRLGYGLKLVEEDDLLNADGTVGQITGLVSSATAFTGGATNQTRIDTILKAFTQVSLSEYDASGIILHPNDWMEIQLAKDTQGRYLFSDPHGMEQPRIWGKPVVATQSMTSGTFLAGAFDLAAAIYDREDMNIRISDQHQDFFTKNLVAILCEERLALAIYRSAAIVTGNMTFAG